MTTEIESLIATSPETGELFAALALAQAEMGGASKSSANPFFKSKYADLSEVRKTAMVIHQFGLCISQFPVGSSGLVTILGHKSGQFIKAEMHMTPVKNDPQGIGSCITYMRRYAMQSVLGIPAEDDDGNKATYGNKTPEKKTFSKVNVTYTLNEKKALFNALERINTERAINLKKTRRPWDDATWDAVKELVNESFNA